MTVLAGRVAAEPEQAGRSGPRARGPTPDRLPRLARPPQGEGLVPLEGQSVGGLVARYAEWRAGGVGRLVATGESPWLDTTAVFPVDDAGRPAGQVAMTSSVRLLGYPLASVAQTVDWDGVLPLPLPQVQLDGPLLRVTGGQVTVVPGIDAVTDESGTTITLPPALSALTSSADPVATGLLDVLSALLGQDLSPLSVRAGDTGDAPGVLAGDIGVVAPEHLPPDSPRDALVLDAVARAWLADRDGPVVVDPSPADPNPRVRVDRPPDQGPTTPTGRAPVDLSAGEAEAKASLPTADAAPAAEVEAQGEAAVGEEPGVEPGSAETVEPGAEATAELIMPPAPDAPGPAQAARAGAVGGAAGRAAGGAATLPPAEATVGAARGAVAEPPVETTARAGAALAEAMGGRAAPSPEIVALAERIRAAIRERRPVDEDELTRADIQGAAREAGQSLDTAVEGDAQRVQESYAPLAETPSGTPATTAVPVTPQDPHVADPGIDAPRAAPDAIPDENLSLDADRDRVETMATESRIERHSTEPLQDTAPYSTVRAERDELAGVASTGPPDVRAQQAAAIAQAQADMSGLQQQALEALNSSRGGAVNRIGGAQGDMVGQETRTRESVSAEAQAIFTDAQTRVAALLEPLSRTAMAGWDAEVARLSREFREHLDEVQRWIDERHSGAGGFVVGLWDAVTGLPGWVTREYDDAERRFGDGVCETLLSISSDVNSVIAAAEAIIEDARTRTRTLFSDLPEDLREWAAGEEARFEAQLDGLAQQAQAARTSFVTEISERAVSAVAEVQHQVEELRQKAAGLVGRIVAAIEAFIDDPVRAIINGLLSLVGIPPPSFWALVEKIAQVIDQIADDPEGFANNLVAALRLGFEGFFERFGTHLIAGFWRWLFSRLGNVGVQLPRDASVGSIVTFILQIMGITWPRIREILVRHIGAENVELIEKVWELVSLLIQRGPDGILEMLRERLDPETIVAAVVEAAVEFVVQALIERVALRLLGMLNPAGAILQAIELIYRVLRWVFENAARIFALVETVVNAAAEILAGNLGGVALMIENALAGLLPLVIDLLAGMIGLGDLPDQVASAIGRLQAVVLPVVERVIVALVTRGRALLAALGLGGSGDGAASGGDEELGTTVRFAAAGESHRLWVQRTGGAASLMVASSPSPIENKIAEWRGRIARNEPAEEAKRTEATGLINQLEPLVTGADQTADQLAGQFQQATADADPATQPPSDDTLESQERTIAGLLDQIFTIFGERPDPEAIIARFSGLLPAMGTAKVGELKSAWLRSLGEIDVGPVGNRQKLVGQADPFGSLDTTSAMAVLADGGNQRALVPYFTLASGERGPETAEFRHFVLGAVRPRPSHAVRVRFVQALGDGAVAALRAHVEGRLPAMTMSDDERAEIIRSLDGVRFVMTDSSVAGRFEGLRDREPDHAFFKPQNIKPLSGGVLEYDTVAGQHFRIEGVVDGLPKKVTGSNLTQFTGRGVTQDSPHFASGQDFNRAHVIANRFGGSGFADMGNLVTTSRHYNHPVMSGAERAIVGYLNSQTRDERRAPTAQPTTGGVTFSLSVGLEYVDPTNRILAVRIAQDPEVADKSDEVRESILQKLESLGLDRRLKRVEKTDYDLGAIQVDGQPKDGAFQTGVGEDVWLFEEIT